MIISAIDRVDNYDLGSNSNNNQELVQLDRQFWDAVGQMSQAERLVLRDHLLQMYKVSSVAVSRTISCSNG
ncbi:MAG TPA: hypothetical protein DDZ80_00955 [Cyanobacteria bacterium UBA8803]|nr:hypothetical protein [Cyanobacteria bacterium UBA9273]HBL57176.1 hypothetical protein [Cyanobacteria bacterium UBA8803]